MTGTDRDPLERFEDVESGLTVHRHTLSSDYAAIKYSLFKRFKREYLYGKKIAEEIRDTRPDVVLSANAPSHVQSQIAQAAADCGATFIPWMQDFYSLAVADHLGQKVPIVGGLLGKLYMNWEKSILRSSERIAVISDDFKPLLKDWGLKSEHLQTIENWAPLEDIPVLPKDNPWARKYGLTDKFCFLYSGTMGLKHNPDILVQLARSFETHPEVRIVVVGEGRGVDQLKEAKLKNLICLPFQSNSDFPQVLATGNVLTALLEPGASQFSVPSKVLSYLCAGRPILLAVPPSNLAARIVTQSEAGQVADPREVECFVEAAHSLYNQGVSLARQGENARNYAETTFRPEIIGQQFNRLILGKSGKEASTAPSPTKTEAMAEKV